MNKPGLLKVVLAVVCLSHLALGILGFISSQGLVTEAIASAYGAALTMTPQLQHVLRILGAFMIAIGVMSAFALLNPVKNRAIINGIIVLLVLRVAQRLVFAQEIHDAFSISSARLWGQSAFFLTLAMALFFLAPRAETASNR